MPVNEFLALAAAKRPDLIDAFGNGMVNLNARVLVNSEGQNVLALYIPNYKDTDPTLPPSYYVTLSEQQ